MAIPFAAVTAMVAVLWAAPADDPPTLGAARGLWQTGKYAQALEAYEAIAAALPADDAAGLDRVALGRAECLAATGEPEKALAALAERIDAVEKPAPDLLARRAALRLDRGDWEGAEADAQAALAVDPDHLAARFVAARLLDLRGRRDEATVAWRWFLDHYNGARKAVAGDAEALLMIGQAAERYYRAAARGEELAESLNDVINDLYEGALKADPKCWQAPYLEGRLFLAGYQEGDARKELNRALVINPSAAEVLVTLGRADLQAYKLGDGRKKAEAALEVNPRSPEAFVLLADLDVADERFADARESARKALAESPRDEEALARLAAASHLLVDPAGAAAAEAVARARNPKTATFYAALGDRLADRRQYAAAERALHAAIAADPEAAAPRIGLGLLYMQVGREPEARDLFEAAFAADPFNVRADNMRRVLKHLAGYTPIESEHYTLLVEGDKDRLLGRYMSRYLESIHDERAKALGFEPPARTLIEVLRDHQWFSGRTTGLPFIPTVGACTGKMIAMASPRATPKPYNWARVLKHEMTHVINLQQTNFNIPHWYTEALAVESEGGPRPQAWNKLLTERVPARKLLNLDTINLGFIRPKEAEERQLAYCQAQLYARYMVKRFGPDALIRLLGAYRRGLTTTRAVTETFAVDKADFEAGYLDYLDEVVKSIRTRVDDEEPVRFSQLQRQLDSKPDDPDLNARMAYEHFARRDYKAARPFADAALKAKAGHPLASYVKARMFVAIGDSDAALELLKPALDPEKPDERVVDLLAELTMKAGDLDEAERLYELARRDDPLHSKWIAGLARVHLRQKDDSAFLADMALLAENDADDLDVRRVLTERHLKAGDAAAAERWAAECLLIQVLDPVDHVAMADALAAQEKHAPAAEELAVALELKPKAPADVQVKLARSLRSLGRLADARAAIDSALAADPEHPEAKALRDELGAAGPEKEKPR